MNVGDTVVKLLFENGVAADVFVVAADSVFSRLARLDARVRGVEGASVAGGVRAAILFSDGWVAFRESKIDLYPA